MSDINSWNYNKDKDNYNLYYEQIQNSKRQQLIKNHVISNGYIELKSDYLGSDSYYYDKTLNVMYKVCNFCCKSGDINPVFEISNDTHILNLNSLIR